MAVNIKPKNPEQVLKAFDISDTMIAKLADCNILVSVENDKVIMADGKGLTKNIPIKSGAMSMALSGKLGPASKSSIQYKLEQSIVEMTDGKLETEMVAAKKKKHAANYGMSEEKLEELLMDEDEEVMPDPPELKTFGEAFGPVAGKVAELSAKTGDIVPMIPPYENLGELLKSNPVPLSEATMMYQPVKGTSGPSKYHVIAMSQDDIRIAARYQNQTLSVRVEGPVKKYKGELEVAGFSMSNINKGYVSVHLEVPAYDLACKTLGAVVAGVQIPMVTPVPQLAVINGEGQ